MKNLKSLCYGTNLWIYYVFCIFTIVGLSIFKPKSSSSTENSENNIRTFTNINTTLPTSDWQPVEIACMSRSKINDIIYLNSQKDSIKIFSNSSESNNFSVVYEAHFEGKAIFNVLAYDYYKTGYNDLILTYQEQNLHPYYYNVGILKNNKGELSKELIQLNIQTLQVPFPVNGDDGTPKLIFVPQNSENAKLYYNDSFSKETTLPSYKSLAVAKLNGSKYHYISLIGEERSMNIQISDDQYKELQTFEVPDYSTSLTIADFNRNGELDILVSVSPKYDSPYFCIYFGTNGKFVGDKQCSSIGSNIKIKPTKFICQNCEIFDHISIADLDLDGRPDIIATTTYGTSIFLNQFCRGCQGGELFFTEFMTIPGKGGIYNDGFSGNYDIVTENGYFKGNLTKNEMFLIINSLDDVCLENCKGERHPNPQPLTTITYGATTNIVYTDKFGQRHKSIGVTRPTIDMQTPQLIFGFGEKLHYIQEVAISSRNTRNLTWVLPNSLVYATQKGQYKVMIGYKTNAYPVICSCTALLLVLGFFVAYYTEKENQEDRKEAAKMLPMF
ncbi:FG-GAP repeat family protein [Trichomonas vaginalis G3]|uniref:FG-GAP repeat family protein n=1 Tax=Trichomonas vaginalis (strain ATCC PRA-98 / G3) TaxID=412133 RepID=A2DGP5_TRIV3|nr:T-cell immunomodulatory protein-like protein family [Trichomonas vaginalis G3]EAY20432.1 FG-GAP repeat family protein [Trichomonas vaginalis G3]KAI5490518.1 T-cell immunomodulatory protein-like protein family [Trichomonas vaginalis G3]|eukprot:XP_001581418.1 FG-GAP repeat family protein [Trichomonas vaginalis G3]